MKKNSQVRIAIFASGKGTNAENIIRHFSENELIHVTLIITNNPQSGVFNFAPNYRIPVILLSNIQYSDGDYIVEFLQTHRINLIVLAGYLKKIPPQVVQTFHKQIINIHPSLLPKYGGKGMYGMKVHEAIIAAREKQSGISIHLVDDIYDHGALIYQAKLDIDPTWSAVDLANEIHKMEYHYYPQVIEKVCKKILS